MTLKSCFEQLADYIDSHFKSEERIFKLTKYPEAESHIKEHENFVRKVTKFKSDFESERIGLNAQMVTFLGDWARNHVKKEDKKYAEFIAKQSGNF